MRLATARSLAPPRFRLQLEQLEGRTAPAVFTVNSLLDGPPAADGQLTLREAMIAANTNAPSGDAPAGQASLDTIQFAPILNGGTIHLKAAQGQLGISGSSGGSLHIIGPSSNPAAITISGQGAARVLFIGSAASAVVLQNLTLSGGKANGGAGLLNQGNDTTLTNVVITENDSGGANGAGILNAGTLTLNRAVVSNNRASTDGTSVGDGGGILHSSGTLNLNESQVVANRADGVAGGVYIVSGTVNITASTIAGNFTPFFGGGIYMTGGTATISRTTIYGNHAATSGGGVAVFGGTARFWNCTVAYNAEAGVDIPGGAAVTIVNSTIAANATSQNLAGGIRNGGGTLVLANSIVALNTAGPTSAHDNVDPAEIDANNDNFINGNPLLGPLQDNGGPTFTMAPMPGSPVIDTGTNSFATQTGKSGGAPLVMDQRGVQRRLDGNNNGTVTVDRGAVEYQPPLPLDPLPPPLIVVGPAKNRPPVINVFQGGQLLYSLAAYPNKFKGGVRVASGDVNGDGVKDIITAPGPGISTQVKVFDGQTRTLLFAFLPYGPKFKGGAFVATGNLDGDAAAEILVGPESGAKPVQVYDGGTLKYQFFPYGPKFAGGVQVAAGDVSGNANSEIVTLRNSKPAQVRIFDAAGAPLGLFNPGSGAGGSLAVANVIGGANDEIIVGTGPKLPARVKAFSGISLAEVGSLAPYGNFKGGVRVAAVDRNGNGRPDLIAGPGKGIAPSVNVFDGLTPALIESFFAFEAKFKEGVFVAG